MYTGTQVIEPQLLEYLPALGECCIVRQGYIPALQDKKKVAAYRYDGYWNDLGTLESYRQAEKELESGRVKFSYLP
jgi:mannose-1-phosphate guanylyltransferase